MSFNPFFPLCPEALAGLTAAGNRFFVRQSFPRGAVPGVAPGRCFLFSHYKSVSKAREHFDVLAPDPYRKLYDLENVEDSANLRKAAAGVPGFRLYTNTFVPSWENHLSRRLNARIRAYIGSLGWQPGSHITPFFYPYFGEVYISLRLGRREIRVALKEIESMP